MPINNTLSLEMEADQGGEDGDDWQAQLSQAIEDMFQEGEPEHAQRGVQAHARAKEQLLRLPVDPPPIGEVDREKPHRPRF